MKLGKIAKNRLKIKEKAEILAQENFQKWVNQLKRGTITPLNIKHPLFASKLLLKINDKIPQQMSTKS